MKAPPGAWQFCTDGPITIEADRPLEAALARHEPCVRRVARRLADGDYQVTEDLVQGARIYLWALDPARYDESPEQQGYLRRAMINRMREMLRIARSGPEWAMVTRGGVIPPFTPSQRRYA